jgi:hypothetical protein
MTKKKEGKPIKKVAVKKVEVKKPEPDMDCGRPWYKIDAPKINVEIKK